MSRFVKGQSGNPAGRPRKTPKVEAVAFDILFDKRLTVTQEGAPRNLSVEEALHHRTYQDALKGSLLATRKILQMIEKRDKAIAAQRPAPVTHPVVWRWQQDSNGADEAMFILGITAERPNLGEAVRPWNFRQLQRWIVEAALKRRGRPPLSERDVSEVRRCTVDGKSLHVAADSPDGANQQSAHDWLWTAAIVEPVQEGRQRQSARQTKRPT